MWMGYCKRADRSRSGCRLTTLRTEAAPQRHFGLALAACGFLRQIVAALRAKLRAVRLGVALRANQRPVRRDFNLCRLAFADVPRRFRRGLDGAGMTRCAHLRGKIRGAALA